MEVNVLLVHVSAARGLYLKNHNSLNAFASLTLQGKGSTRSRVITEQVETAGDCKWDEHCEFKLTEKSQSVLVIVQHKTRLGGSDVIGKCEILLDVIKNSNGHVWYPLKKKKDDEKYRGEIQLQFSCSFVKPNLSISNSSLNKIEKDNVLDRMKRKMSKFGKHKQAEDTMSIASGMSFMSTKSSNNRFMDKLKHIGGLHKSSTLPPTSMSTVFSDEVPVGAEYNSSNIYLAANAASRSPSYPSGLNQTSLKQHGSSSSLTILAPAGLGVALNSSFSPSVSTAESLHRGNSQRSGRSVASSGFQSSKLLMNGLRENDAGSNQNDLMAENDSLRLELQVKDARLRDMQEYMDSLISRVMEHCPEVLAAPVGPDRRPAVSRNTRGRYF